MSKKNDTKPRKSRPPGKSPEARENQLINAAVALAEKQLEAGTASAMVITHYLKLGSTTQRLEREKLKAENSLLKAKTEALQSQKRTEDLYTNALDAIRSYRSNDNTKEEDIEDSDL